MMNAKIKSIFWCITAGEFRRALIQHCNKPQPLIYFTCSVMVNQCGLLGVGTITSPPPLKMWKHTAVFNNWLRWRPTEGGLDIGHIFRLHRGEPERRAARTKQQAGIRKLKYKYRYVVDGLWMFSTDWAGGIGGHQPHRHRRKGFGRLRAIMTEAKEEVRWRSRKSMWVGTSFNLLPDLQNLS